MIDPLINISVNELIKIMKSVPEDKDNDAQDLPIGIQLLKPEVFVSPIADWP